MAEDTTRPRRIREPFFTVFFRSSLWNGGDHLLIAEQRGFRENYRRFDYADIQALMVCQSERRLTLGIVFGLCLLVGLVILGASTGNFGKISGGVLSALFGVLSLVNILKGPGCVCELKTSVSRAPLRAITRWKQFERVLPELRAHIAKTQGETKPEDIVNALAARQRAADAAPPVSSAHPSLILTRGEASATIYFVLFSVLIADAVLALTAFAGTHPLLTGFRALPVLIALFCAIGALARHRSGAVALPLRRLTIVSLSYLGAAVAGVYCLLIFLQIQDPENPAVSLDLFYLLTSASPYGSAWWFLLFLANALFSASLGVAGLLQAARYRKGRMQKAVAPPVPSAP